MKPSPSRRNQLASPLDTSPATQPCMAQRRAIVYAILCCSFNDALCTFLDLLMTRDGGYSIMKGTGWSFHWILFLGSLFLYRVWKQQIRELRRSICMRCCCGGFLSQGAFTQVTPVSRQRKHYLAIRGLHMIAAAAGVLWEGSRRGPSLRYSSWRVQSLRWGISGVTITKRRLPDAIEQSAATVSETQRQNR